MRWQAILGLVVSTLLLAGLTVMWFAGPGGTDGPNPAEVVASSRPGATEDGLNERPDGAPSAPADTGELDQLPDLYPGVDWAEVRARIPYSRVWDETLPPATPAEEQHRAELAREQNLQFGRIQAGHAETEEIDTYFDDKVDLLEDNLEFVGILLSDYREALSERDQGLLEMTFRMTHKRLEQIPDERARAHDRKVEQDEARAAWNASP